MPNHINSDLRNMHKQINSKKSKPPPKTPAEKQRTYRLKKKLMSGEQNPSKSVVPAITAQLAPSSPDMGPTIIQHEAVIETVPSMPSNRKRKAEESIKVSSKYNRQLNRLEQRSTEVDNFDEIRQLPSQSIQSPYLSNDEIQQVLNQQIENRDFNESIQPQNLHDGDDGEYAESVIEDEQIDNEDDFNLDEILLAEDNSSHPYSGYRLHQSAHKLFQKMFVENDFGHVCNVCDRLWFLNDLKTGRLEDENLLKQITVCRNFIFYNLFN